MKRLIPVLTAVAVFAAAPLFDEQYRPQFHFSPERNWTNDPCGLVYARGEYHLFFQFNPFGDQWGHMSWGHAVSLDLVHWKQMPVAIPESNGVMIFTGSSVIDANNSSGLCAKPGCIVSVYTGHRPKSAAGPARQNQNLAFSNDGQTWTKYRGNPVLDVGKSDFRDPKVFWHAPTRKWIMVVMLPRERKAQFYGSADLKHWQHLSDFGPAGATGGDWECPDFYELPVDGNPNNTRWVLKIGLNPGHLAGGSGEQYFVGRFDGRRFTNDNPPDRFAGSFVLNGNGELTGLAWIAETGLLHGPIGLTNTQSVGLVRDALASHGLRTRGAQGLDWALPVAGETWDGQLNDIAGQHVRPEHVDTALVAAEASPLGAPVPEGAVGGGTGMICHEFKGGIGTASRVLADGDGGWTVGVLVQANSGRRGLLRVDGVPVGQAIDLDEVPSPYGHERRRTSDGSIIGIVGTDAPLLPHQCQRVAKRFAVGLARVGGIGAATSGDLFLAFATGNRGMPPAETEDVRVRGERPGVVPVRSLADRAMDQVFEATVEATEEAIVNALVAAETMTGRDGITAHRLPHDRLVEVMEGAGRLRGHP